MTRSERCDAVVIGAGCAGLAAATRLQAHGFKVQVLEAQERVGGRVRSLRRGDGVEEAGGATIGGGYANVIAAAKRHGVELIDATPMLAFFREQELVLRGEIVRQAEWPAHPANPFPDADRALMPWAYSRVLAARHNPLPCTEDWLDAQYAPHDVPMHDWMRSLGLSEQAAALGYDLNASYGDDARDISMLTLFARAAFSATQRKLAPAGVVGYTARDGVQRIPEAMASALRNGVHLRTVVIGIEDSEREAEVRCADGSSFRARHVVCSLPFGVLRHIAIHPPLTGRQAEAVASLPSQPMTQLYFACKSAFWEEDGYSPSLFTDGLAGMVAASRRGEDPAEVTGLTAWAMGRNARRLDALPQEQAAALVIREIEAVRPAARGQLAYIGRQCWGADAFAGGGWAYFRPGQASCFGAAMGASHGRIRFCGEHLARANRGMEGAMESGARAAAEIVALE